MIIHTEQCMRESGYKQCSLNLADRTLTAAIKIGKVSG